MGELTLVWDIYVPQYQCNKKTLLSKNLANPTTSGWQSGEGECGAKGLRCHASSFACAIYMKLIFNFIRGRLFLGVAPPSMLECPPPRPLLTESRERHCQQQQESGVLLGKSTHDLSKAVWTDSDTRNFVLLSRLIFSYRRLQYILFC